MGQSSNEVLHAPLSLRFTPSLGSTITVGKLTSIPGKPHLRWQATLGREDYDRLCSYKSEVQVWSNCTGEQWSATSFKQCATLNASNEVVERVDLSWLECMAGTTDDQVLIEASIPIPSPVDRTVEFTYRVVYASGHTDWLGTNDTNGKVVVSIVEEEDCLKAENWINEGDTAAFLWTCTVREPTVISRLGNDAKWNGWAFKKENTGSSAIIRFAGLSESVTGSVVALALLPQARQGACIAYSPVLYTPQYGTLSLEGNNVILHPGKGEPTKLNAYTLPSTWKDHIPHKPSLLDIQTSDFLAVSHKNHMNVNHLHLLPLTGAQSIFTLTMSDVTSVAPSSSVLLFDPSLCAIKFLPALSPIERLRIAVGAAGGEICAVPAYTMSASISVAFLHDKGSITELKVSAGYHSEHSSSSQEFASESLSAESVESNPVAAVQLRPKAHSSALPAILLLVVQVLQSFLTFVVSTISPISLSVSERVTDAVPSSEDVSTSPRLMFEVTGNLPLLVIGEDTSKLRILVGGKPLQATPKDIGEGHWLIESTSELDNDHDQRRVEILLEG